MKLSSRSVSSVTQQESIRDRVSHWLLLRGDCRVVAVGLTAVVEATTLVAAIRNDEITFAEPEDRIREEFGHDHEHAELS